MSKHVIVVSKREIEIIVMILEHTIKLSDKDKKFTPNDELMRLVLKMLTEKFKQAEPIDFSDIDTTLQQGSYSLILNSQDRHSLIIATRIISAIQKADGFTDLSSHTTNLSNHIADLIDITNTDIADNLLSTIVNKSTHND